MSSDERVLIIMLIMAGIAVVFHKRVRDASGMGMVDATMLSDEAYPAAQPPYAFMPQMSNPLPQTASGILGQDFTRAPSEMPYTEDIYGSCGC